MRIAFDTEFIENGKTIDLISIGMVREDGEELYYESCEANLPLASDWVRQNVFPHLNMKTSVRRDYIAEQIHDFVGETPQFWAWYAAYDWVALCQLYGRMLDLPTGWPMYCLDLKQHCVMHNIDLKQNDSNHNALNDARWLDSRLREFML